MIVFTIIGFIVVIGFVLVLLNGYFTISNDKKKTNDYVDNIEEVLEEIKYELINNQPTEKNCKDYTIVLFKKIAFQIKKRYVDNKQEPISIEFGNLLSNPSIENETLSLADTMANNLFLKLTLIDPQLNDPTLNDSILQEIELEMSKEIIKFYSPLTETAYNNTLFV